jgi:hypothetical protein
MSVTDPDANMPDQADRYFVLAARRFREAGQPLDAARAGSLARGRTRR